MSLDSVIDQARAAREKAATDAAKAEFEAHQRFQLVLKQAATTYRQPDQTDADDTLGITLRRAAESKQELLTSQPARFACYRTDLVSLTSERSFRH